MSMIQNRQGRMVNALWASREEHYRIKDNLTISSDAFADVVLKAILEQNALSVVRMSDGEDELLLYCKSRPAEELVPNRQFPEEWQKRLGVWRISCETLRYRLTMAAEKTQYFAPDGERNHLREHFGLREDGTLVELYYPYRMPVEKKREMFRTAGSVLIVNGYAKYVDAIRAGAPEGVEVIHTSIRQWQDTEAVIAEAAQETTPLVLVSAGPAGKYMIPEIAKQGKVVLDIGDGMGSWWWPNGVAPDGRMMNTNGELEPRK